MTELGDIFAELGISHYLHDFIEQGFDTWDTILDITESDFDALGVKLGHRRKLQRKIANSRGVSSDRALASPRNTPSDDRHLEDQKPGATKADNKDGGGTQGAKRKYRRHPKPDENAPERPPSAYVIFSNKMREELKGRNLSFTEIAKLVGENWQNLSPAEKEPYEQQAFSAKERYNNELAEYKKTENYREYAQYLAEFKARQSNQQPVTDLDASKRPKLENHASSASNGTASSGTSQHGADTPTGRMRVESTSSHTNQWHAADGPSPRTSNMPKLNVAPGGLTAQVSPKTTSPSILPGYRDSIFNGAHQPLPWREGQREDSVPPLQQLPGLSSVGDRRSSYPGGPVGDSLSLTRSSQHNHRTGQSQPPPLLKSESTNRSSTSSASTGFYTPRTPMGPMEPQVNGVMPLPSLYPQKSTGSYDSKLPPLITPSLSPQTTMLGSQQSPNGVHPIMDFPTTMAPLRGYPATAQPSSQIDNRHREFISSNPGDDNLDPVSALLKAGEIVNRNSRGHPGS